MTAQIETDFPENHGLSSKSLVAFFNQIELLNLHINSLMLLQDGKATAQFWRKPYRKGNQQLLFSLSKSFTSIAVGIARDCGFLDLHDKVISFFPDQLPATVSPNLAQMTIHHLLSMNAGHHDNIYSSVAKEKDWVRAFLSLDVQHEPGSYYRYSTHSTFMLSAIIEQVTGCHLVDFLMPRLFEPLGIPRPSWETSPMGITAGGMGLSISTESIAKFGQMLLDKGMYEGRRIVSEAYIELATQEQSDNRRDEERVDTSQGYGYQFFLCRRGCYRGDGGFGQMCFVAPKERIVIAVTSSFTSMKQLQTLLDLIYEYIIDQLDNEINVTSRALEDSVLLQKLLAEMTYPLPLAQPVPDNIPHINNLFYRMEANSPIQKLGLNLQGDQLEFQLIYENGEHQLLLFNMTQPVYTEDRFIKDLSLHQQEVVTYAYWHDKSTLKLALYYIETPYVVTYTVLFYNNSVELQFHINVSRTLEDYTISGILVPSNSQQDDSK